MFKNLILMNYNATITMQAFSERCILNCLNCDPRLILGPLKGLKYIVKIFKDTNLDFLRKKLQQQNSLFFNNMSFKPTLVYLRSMKKINHLVLFRDHLKIEVHLLKEYMRKLSFSAHQSRFKKYYNSLFSQNSIYDQ